MYLKCIQSGFVVQKEYVRVLLQLLNPNGVEQRRKRKLKRRKYISKGPNYAWHLDSYDKLKPFGVCINGCIDGFSRHIIWMEAGKTNNNPNVIRGYFFSSDFGYWWSVMYTTGRPWYREQSFCRIANLPFRPVYIRHKSTQPVLGHGGAFCEKKRTQCWMSIFEDIKDDGLFSGVLLDKSLIQFCFLPVIKEELADFVNEWNTHRIRKHTAFCGGRPVTLYNLPEVYGTHDYLRIVEREELDVCEEFENDANELACDQDVFELATLYMEEMNLQMPTNAYDAANFIAC